MILFYHTRGESMGSFLRQDEVGRGEQDLRDMLGVIERTGLFSSRKQGFWSPGQHAAKLGLTLLIQPKTSGSMINPDYIESVEVAAWHVP